MKRIIYTLTCLLLSIGVWAQNVAKIGGTEYATLADAVAAATDGQTITLISDVTLTAVCNIGNKENVHGRNLSIDFNNHSISSTASTNGQKIFTIYDDVALIGNGEIQFAGSGMSAYAIGAYGNVVIDGVNVTDVKNNAGYIIYTGANATVTLKSGTIKSDKPRSVVYVAKSGTYVMEGGNLISNYASNSSSAACVNVAAGGEATIKGGTLTSPNVGLWADGTLNIEGGTFTSDHIVWVNNGTANINGGDFKAGTTAVYLYKATSKATISGGEFTATGSNKDFLLNKLDAVRETAELSVTGGTFHDFNPWNNKAEGEGTSFVPEDYEVVDNGDGTFSIKEIEYVAQIGENKYESLAEAITAVQNEETVILLADVTENVTIPAGKNITLDLNSKTLNGKKAANTPTIKNQGTLTLKNGNVRREGEGSASWYVIENEGTITMDEGLNVEGSASSSLIRNNAATAQMTFSAGTYTQTGAFIVVKNDLGNVVINGGTFSTATDKNVLNNWDQMTINGGTFTGNIFNGAYDTDNNKLTINDGTFNTSQIRTYLDNGKTSCPIEIKGGTFTNAQMKYVGTGNKESDTDVQVAVSGGTFANVVPEKYCAEGFSPVTTPDSNGMYTVETTKVAMIGDARYASLVEAVEAATDDATIKLIRDGLKYEYVEPNRVITLDLNGFTYDCNIDNYGTLTIVDNSEEGTGKLVNSKKHWIVWNNPIGKLTVQSGTIAFETRENAKSDTGQQTIVNEGSLIVNGGTIDGYTADYNTGIADSYTDTYAVENVDGDVTINGGKLMGLHSLATFGGTSAVINGGQFIVPFGPGTNAVYNNTDELTVSINGGTFIGDTDYLINKNDNSCGSFCITGGKFYKYDPQHSKSENPIANFVPKEYAAQKDADGYYVIVPAIAYIDEMGYAVLDIAIEEAKETGDATTITLLSDAETEKETLPTNVTINANDKVLTMPSFVVLDGEAFTLPNITGADTYKVKLATYKRTNISTTEWGTVCLPFSLTNENGADYYTYNNISGSTLTVDKTTSTVDPNTPVVFKKAKGGDLEINQTNAIVSLKEPLSLASGALVGTYTDADITATGSIYFINGDLFHQAQVSVKVPMYRAYIVKTSGAKPRTISIAVSGSDDSTATGIKVVKTTKTVKTGNSNTTPKTNKDTSTSTAEQPEIVEVYDATGRRIPATRKGLNLVKLSNGKVVKLFVK